MFLLVVVDVFVVSLAGVKGGVGRLLESLELWERDDGHRLTDLEDTGTTTSDSEIY